jgi:hypothetical protein
VKLPPHIIGSLLRKYFPGLAKSGDDDPPSPGFSWEHYEYTKDESDVSMAKRVMEGFTVSIFASSLFHIRSIRSLSINYFMHSCSNNILALIVKKRWKKASRKKPERYSPI